MKTLTIAAALLLALALGCESKEKPQTTTTPPAQGAGASATPASGTPAGDEGIATEEDFEEEAEQKITSQNAQEELDKLEKEISANN